MKQNQKKYRRNKDTFETGIENAILANLVIQGKPIPEKFQDRDVSKEVKLLKKFSKAAK